MLSQLGKTSVFMRATLIQICLAINVLLAESRNLSVVIGGDNAKNIVQDKCLAAFKADREAKIKETGKKMSTEPSSLTWIVWIMLVIHFVEFVASAIFTWYGWEFSHAVKQLTKHCCMCCRKDNENKGEVEVVELETEAAFQDEEENESFVQWCLRFLPHFCLLVILVIIRMSIYSVLIN